MDSSCCNEQLMQIPPSSWIPFGTRQMVHPQNHDSTNFTESRFSQDSEHKWIDGETRDSYPQLTLFGWLLCFPGHCASQSVFPTFPGALSCKASSQRASFWDLFNPSAFAFLRLSDKGACVPQCQSLTQRVVSDSTEAVGCRESTTAQNYHGCSAVSCCVPSTHHLLWGMMGPRQEGTAAQ